MINGIKTLAAFIKNNKYTWVLLYLILYLVIFFVLDKAIDPENVHILYLPIDDKIPFISIFFIPYMLWFPMLILLLIEFMLRDKEDFMDYWFMMFTGMNICFIIYVVWPNGLALRVNDVADSDILGQLMKMIWSIDPPVNVCPSLHVTSSITAMIAVCAAGHLKGKVGFKLIVCLFFIAVIASTVFLKQHSVIDLIAAAVLSVFMAAVCYLMPWKKLFVGPFKVLVE